MYFLWEKIVYAYTLNPHFHYRRILKHLRQTCFKNNLKNRDLLMMSNVSICPQSFQFYSIIIIILHFIEIFIFVLVYFQSGLLQIRYLWERVNKCQYNNTLRNQAALFVLEKIQLKGKQGSSRDSTRDLCNETSTLNNCLPPIISSYVPTGKVFHEENNIMASA